MLGLFDREVLKKLCPDGFFDKRFCGKYFKILPILPILPHTQQNVRHQPHMVHQESTMEIEVTIGKKKRQEPSRQKEANNINNSIFRFEETVGMFLTSMSVCHPAEFEKFWLRIQSLRKKSIRTAHGLVHHLLESHLGEVEEIWQTALFQHGSSCYSTWF